YARLGGKRYSIVRTSEHSTPTMISLGITLLKPSRSSITEENHAVAVNAVTFETYHLYIATKQNDPTED
ncbi:16458_t:CDS:2, partial [Cetraspora pellucida]